MNVDVTHSCLSGLLVGECLRQGKESGRKSDLCRVGKEHCGVDQCVIKRALPAYMSWRWELCL